MKINTSKKKLLSLLFSIIIFILVLELIGRQTENLNYYSSNARFSTPGNEKLFRVSLTPGLGYDLIPNNNFVIGTIHFFTNDVGLRDTNYEVTKQNDVFRIVILGDSTAYGIGVNAEERFSNILGAKLNLNSSAKFEVLNAAIPGYNAIQKLILFKTRVLQYNPDLVIYQFANDDYWKNSISVYQLEDSTTANNEKLFALNMPHIMPLPRSINIFFLEKFSTYRYFNIYTYNILSKINPDRYYPNAYRFLDGLNAVELNKNVFGEFKELGETHNFDFFVVLTPTLVNEDVNDVWIREELKETYGIDTLDIFTKLKSKGVDISSLRVVPKDDTHPNLEGNRLFAEEIRLYLISQNLLPQQ